MSINTLHRIAARVGFGVNLNGHGRAAIGERQCWTVDESHRKKGHMATTHPMRIPGVWRQGYVLDYHTIHSAFLGHDEFGNPIFDTKRTEVGELLY